MVLIYGDLDNLKEINDTFGHKEGDQVLVDISHILKETFRESDIIASIGGDEFVMLAMNSLETSGEKLINRFEQVLNDHHLQTKPPYKLAMSFGIACFNPQNPSSIDALLVEADKLMYENKQRKRRLGDDYGGLLEEENNIHEISSKILIVEDSPVQAEKLKYSLEKHGFQVMAANNGAQALEELKKGYRPFIIVSDIIMPEMDGYEFCKKSEKIKTFEHIVVILLTALSEMKDIIRGLECGANSFIIKPFDEKI